jgi:hypothetical protein
MSSSPLSTEEEAMEKKRRVKKREGLNEKCNKILQYFILLLVMRDVEN